MSETEPVKRKRGRPRKAKVEVIKTGPVNKGGRPKGTRNAVTREHQATLAELARKHTKKAIETLVSLMETGSDSAKAAACNSLLDRGYGKALQTVVDEDGDRVPSGIKVTFVNPSSAE